MASSSAAQPCTSPITRVDKELPFACFVRYEVTNDSCGTSSMIPQLPKPLRDASLALQHIGVQCVGIATGPAASALGASVVVFGSGGSALWHHARKTMNRSHPIDALVRDTVCSQPLPAGARWILCADDSEERVDFQALALEAGLGHRGPFGLILHPTYGPWFALRAACVLPVSLPSTGPLLGPAPCHTCATRPCQAACPAGAVSSDYDFPACHAWQAKQGVCQPGCHARIACPVGREHAYGALQHRYHHDRAGRAQLQRELARGDHR